jgi:hypothetical protein
MGNGASVSIPPNAVNSMKYALIRSGNQAVQMYHTARRVYNVVDQRFIQKVTKAVEKQILKRIDRVIDKIEVKSKYLFVKSISTTTVADTFSIEVRE